VSLSKSPKRGMEPQKKVEKVALQKGARRSKKGEKGPKKR